MRNKSKGMGHATEEAAQAMFFIEPEISAEENAAAIESRAGQVLDLCSVQLGELVEEWLAEKLQDLTKLEESIDAIVDNIVMKGQTFNTSLTIVAASCCERLADYLCQDHTSLADVLSGNGPIQPCFARLQSQIENSLPPPIAQSGPQVSIASVIDWVVEASCEGLPRAREEISALTDELGYHSAFFTVVQKASGQMGLARARPRGYVVARVGQVLLDNLVVPLVPKRHVDTLMANLVQRYPTTDRNLKADAQVASYRTQSAVSSQATYLEPTMPDRFDGMGMGMGLGMGGGGLNSQFPPDENSDQVTNKMSPEHSQHPRHPASSPLAATRSLEWEMLPLMSAPRNRCAATAVNGKIYVMGGYDGRNCLASCEVFDPQLRIWIPLASMPRKCDGCSAAAVDNKIYVVGGYRNNKFHDPVVFDVSLNTWSKLPRMTTKRGDCATTSLDRKVYAIGGFDGKNDLSSVECYDVDTRMWTNLAPMSVRRSRCAAAAIAGQPRIFVFGGFDGESFWDTCEVLHVQSGSWSPLPKMSVRRCDCSAASLIDGRIVVVGGYNGRNAWDIAEVLDLKTGTWSRLPHTRVRRASAGCVSIGHKLFVCGGFDRVHCLASVESLHI